VGGLVEEVFAADFSQIVGGLPDGVFVFGLPGPVADVLSEVADSEPVRRRCKGSHYGQRGADAGFVGVDAADTGGT
jgi:hypothetical protein